MVAPRLTREFMLGLPAHSIRKPSIRILRRAPVRLREEKDSVVGAGKRRMPRCGEAGERREGEGGGGRGRAEEGGGGGRASIDPPAHVRPGPSRAAAPRAPATAGLPRASIAGPWARPCSPAA